MHGTRRRTLPAGLAAAVLVAAGAIGSQGCGSDDATVPTADALAAHLIDVDTYQGDWTVNIPPDAPATASGVVTDELRPFLPRMELCERAGAASLAAADDLRWMAFRQLDLAEDDPIDPPADTTGHLIFVQEMVTSAAPAEVASTFDLLRAGMDACLGEIAAGDEGPGFAETMPLPAVGDARVGVLTTIAEAGGGAEWRLHSALVRDGAVLVSVLVVDIRAGAEPYFTTADVGRMVATAVDLL